MNVIALHEIGKPEVMRVVELLTSEPEVGEVDA